MLEIMMVPGCGLVQTIANFAIVDPYYPMKPGKRVLKWPETAIKHAEAWARPGEASIFPGVIDGTPVGMGQKASKHDFPQDSMRQVPLL
jgi:hypothetical protein